MDILTLGHGHRPGGDSKTERNYIDFFVSGQSLGQLLRVGTRDQVGLFGWIGDIWHENDRVDEFLGLIPPELTTGRTGFYGCPECSDIGCGAITAKIEVTDQFVVWKDFGYETDYSTTDLSSYREVGPFTFERVAYYRTFDQLRRLILKR